MKSHCYRQLSKAFLLIILAFLLDSCALFRKKKEETYHNYPSNNKSNPPASKNYNSRTVNELIGTARQYIGVPYRSGGIDGNGMDCSGLLFTTFKQVGFSLPRISWQQSEVGKDIDIDELRPGDLVFFVTNKGNVSNINHSGMITEIRNPKEVYFIHASSSKGIREDNLFTTYWMSCFAKAKRPF